MGVPSASYCKTINLGSDVAEQFLHTITHTRSNRFQLEKMFIAVTIMQICLLANERVYIF